MILSTELEREPLGTPSMTPQKSGRLIHVVRCRDCRVEGARNARQCNGTFKPLQPEQTHPLLCRILSDAQMHMSARVYEHGPRYTPAS